MKDRDKIYPGEKELKELGFNLKGKGHDPRDFWWEVDLDNCECDYEAKLILDSYFDFSIEMPELTEPIPLHFKNPKEIEIFIAVFKRNCNHSFAGMIDVCTSKTHKQS